MYIPALIHRPLQSDITLLINGSRNCCISESYSEAFLWDRLPLAIIKVKEKFSRYRPGVAQRMVRGIALLFHDRGTRRGWVVSSTPRPHFTPWEDPVPIVQEAGWAPGPVWTGGKSRPHRDSIPDLPAYSSVAIPTELSGPLPLTIIPWQI